MQRIFQMVGEKYGYEDVKAKFTAFRDFKVKWMRSYKWIEFDVSDYLKDAPNEVLEALAKTLFAKIKGENASYPELVVDWLTRPDFVDRNQPIYIRRCRGLSKTCEGANHDLFQAYERLLAKGLVDYDEQIAFRWGAIEHSVGHSSVLMKTVVISERLDSEEVSEDLLDYALYTQLVHVGMGFNPSGEPRGGHYEEELNKYPNRVEMEDSLHEMRLRV